MNTAKKGLLKLISLLFIVVGVAMTPLSDAYADPLRASLLFVSDPGDYVGFGEAQSLDQDEATFNVTLSPDLGVITVSVFSDFGNYWFLQLTAPQGQELGVGLYENAQMFSQQNPDQAGMSFSVDGRSCSELSGEFEVLNAAYGPFGYIHLFHATFRQYCDGADVGLEGEIYIENPPPPDPLSLKLTVDGQGSLYKGGILARVSGTIVCSEETDAWLSGSVYQRASRFKLAAGYFFLNIQCSTALQTWTAHVFPSFDSALLNAGPAQIDVVAAAYDEDYGTSVWDQVTAYIHLKGRRGRIK